jgi:hypothetical protein
MEGIPNKERFIIEVRIKPIFSPKLPNKEGDD